MLTRTAKFNSQTAGNSKDYTKSAKFTNKRSNLNGLTDAQLKSLGCSEGLNEAASTEKLKALHLAPAELAVLNQLIEEASAEAAANDPATDIKTSQHKNLSAGDNTLKVSASVANSQRVKTSVAQTNTSAGAAALDSHTGEAAKNTQQLNSANILDQVLNKLPEKNKVVSFVHKVANNEHQRLNKNLNSTFLLVYLLAPLKKVIPFYEQVFNFTNRADIVTKAAEKLIKSAKQNDSTRMLLATQDIYNSITKSVADFYLERNLVVAGTNAAEWQQEARNGEAFKNVVEAPVDMFSRLLKIPGEVLKNPAKLKSLDWLRQSGTLALLNMIAGGVSAEAVKNGDEKTASGARFAQCAVSDLDKAASKNPDRNYSTFAFTLENAFDNINRFFFAKKSSLLLAARSIFSIAGRGLALEAQNQPNDENMITFFDNPVVYSKNAIKRIFDKTVPSFA